MRLKDKVCLVTGSSSGIGEAIARAYFKEGAKVVVTYNTREQRARELACEFQSMFLRLDVKCRASVYGTMKEIEREYSRVDVLVNNAGINHPANFDWQTDAEWDEVLDVNLSGVFRCCQAVLGFMPDGGRIINIGSLSGEYGGPRSPAYCVSKAGVMALTHNVARFVGHRQICVNCLSPGVIESPLADKTVTDGIRAIIERGPLGRLGRMDELTGAAIFLASDESSYMTGQTISINGGVWV